MTLLKTLFIITVSTSRLIFPGMPATTDYSDNAKIPAAKSLSLELTSNTTAAKTSKISVTVPIGLGVGNAVDLQIDPNGLEASQKPEASKVKLFEYWGIGREAKGDQPKITPVGTIPEEPVQDIPDKFYASWPNVNTKPLSDEASAIGTYSLKADTYGTATITLAKEQNFLDPINITSPDSTQDLGRAITIRWKPISNAVGYILKAYGGNDKKMITWTSSASPELAQNIDYHPVTKDDLDKFIKEGALIPPYVVSCTIPAGIFSGSDSVMLVMTALGKDFIQTKDGIDTWVVVRSTASLPLHITPPVIPPSKHKHGEE